MEVYWTLLAVIAVERVAELMVSQRHAAALLRRGGVEYGAGHFPVMVALHVGLLAGCVIEPLALHRPFIPALAWPMLVVVVAANSLRWWCIATLGQRWTARVIVIPGLPLVRSGPYRWFAHPNYRRGRRRGCRAAPGRLGVDHGVHLHRPQRRAADRPAALRDAGAGHGRVITVRA